MSSKRWPNGSTRDWRKTRAYVLERDQRRCQLRRPGCTFRATHVHHTGDRTVTGDDPKYLLAACEHCNLSAGDPTRAGNDPAPQPRTAW